VITTVMPYWMTGRVLSSSRAYHALTDGPAADRPTEATVPTAFAPYPADKWSPPKSLFDAKEYKKRRALHGAAAGWALRCDGGARVLGRRPHGVLLRARTLGIAGGRHRGHRAMALNRLRWWN
jgi:hypothetical protein